MKLADWAVRAVVIVTFFALLIAPEKWSFALVLIALGIVGTWALLYPQGVLGWVKTVHPSFHVDDCSLWWVPRPDRRLLRSRRSDICSVWPFSVGLAHSG
jgi:disulfide bond formation protein DsbB